MHYLRYKIIPPSWWLIADSTYTFIILYSAIITPKTTCITQSQLYTSHINRTLSLQHLTRVLFTYRHHYSVRIPNQDTNHLAIHNYQLDHIVHSYSPTSYIQYSCFILLPQEVSTIQLIAADRINAILWISSVSPIVTKDLIRCLVFLWCTRSRGWATLGLGSIC